jgi:hypothetical protein
MLRLAGTRVNPNTNGPHLQFYSVSMTLKNIADGKETPVALPAGAKDLGRSMVAGREIHRLRKHHSERRRALDRGHNYGKGHEGEKRVRKYGIWRLRLGKFDDALGIARSRGTRARACLSKHNAGRA